METSNNPSKTGGSKRRRKTRNGEEKNQDRISDLPNHLLLHILSSMPTKYAARTSVLSKSWQYVWTYIPILDFNDFRDIRHHKKPVTNKNLNSFVSFINRSLIRNRSSKIEKFRVHLNYNTAFASDVDAWLSFAMTKNVEELDLNLSRSKVNPYYYSRTCRDYDDDDDDDDNVDLTTRYHLPTNMLSSNSSLTTLKLKNCEIDHGSLINWKSLKVLSLCRMCLNDGFARKMLSGCPSLELLELFDIWDLEYLDIESERLRKLVTSEREVASDEDAIVLKISAPHLQSLDISGFLCKYSLSNLSSLVDAKLNFYLSSSSDIDQNHDKYTKIMVEHLKNLRHAKDLTMGSSCLQVLSMLEEKALDCLLSSWVCLKLDTGLGERELPGITRLLRHTPLIETLAINMTKLMHFVTESLKSHDLWSSQKSSFTLALQNLKTVRIFGFQASKSEVELLLFLLENASMLEKMIIHPQNSTFINLKESVDATQTLLSFPRFSPNAVVLFS